MKPQQECITAYVFPGYIYLLPDGHPSRPRIVFPKAADKLLSLIDKELEKERKSF